MTCRLCDLDVPLIKAHVIPKPFFTVYGSGDHAPKVLSNTTGVHPKRIRIGFYDDGILCAACDQRIGVWDQYGVELFLHQLDSFEPFPNATAPVGFAREEFDSVRLRLFLLSVLWRASISSHPMFNRVDLGPYSGRFRQIVQQGDPGDPNEFSIVLSAFTAEGRFPQAGVPIMDPFRERWEGANAYRLSLGLITAYIKVDRARFPSSLDRMTVKEGQPLFVIERDFPSSHEAGVARAIAQAPQNRSAFRRR